MKKSTKRKIIVFLAYFHGIGVFIIGLFIIPLLFAEEYELLIYGLTMITQAAYRLIGCRMRWKHVYCGIQFSLRRKMTPERIRWNELSKPDMYLEPGIFFFGGIALLAIYFSN
ncbi:MAG: hypothetical protein IKM61_07790 [Eubacteriaceae bacterium]|nr:hypothetical protein [Eubacteriaceae bacterium]